jgi:hypothetical protein
LKQGEGVMMMIKSVKSVRDEVLKAYEAAKVADDNWQAELDRLKVDRYSQAARGLVGSKLRELYDAKIAADAKRAKLTDIMQRYQDPRQVIN